MKPKHTGNTDGGRRSGGEWGLSSSEQGRDERQSTEKQESEKEQSSRDPVEETGQEAPKLRDLLRQNIIRDPYKLGILLQICLIALLISLFIYCLFAFFAVLDRLSVSMQRVFPLAVAAVIVFLTRRALILLRRLRDGGS